MRCSCAGAPRSENRRYTPAAKVLPTKRIRLTWEGVASSQKQTIRGDGRRVWVLHTLARNMEAGAPDLRQTLRDECSVAGVFRGTVADGDVTVCSLPPVNRALGSPPSP